MSLYKNYSNIYFQVDELEEIVELYNKYIYPPETEPDFYEDLKDNTDLIIRKVNYRTKNCNSYPMSALVR